MARQCEKPKGRDSRVQRLQAVRAIKLYRNLVLKTQWAALYEIRQTLGRLADRECAAGGDSASRERFDLIGSRSRELCPCQNCT